MLAWHASSSFSPSPVRFCNDRGEVMLEIPRLLRGEEGTEALWFLLAQASGEWKAEDLRETETLPLAATSGYDVLCVFRGPVTTNGNQFPRWRKRTSFGTATSTTTVHGSAHAHPHGTPRDARVINLSASDEGDQAKMKITRREATMRRRDAKERNQKNISTGYIGTALENIPMGMAQSLHGLKTHLGAVLVSTKGCSQGLPIRTLSVV